MKPLLLLTMMMSIVSISQTTVTLQPGSSGKDAMVVGHPTYANTNYGSLTQHQIQYWTISGSTMTKRNYLEFDLSSIPENAIVLSADLTLYGQSFQTILSGSNALYIRKVTESWDESTLTWNNKPASTSTGQISVAHAGNSTADDVFDVTDHVQEFVSRPCNNFGWEFRLQNETTLYSKRFYYSSDYTVASKRPKLVVDYILPMELDAYTVTHASSGESDGSINITMDEGAPPYTYSWTGPGSFTSSSEDITELEPGVYYLTVTDDEGYNYYDYFLVGRECEITQVEIQPDANFGIDAYVWKDKSCALSANSSLFFSYKHNSGDVDRGLINFSSKGLNSDTQILTADLDLDGTSHFNTYEDNTSTLYRNTESWTEATADWDNKPAYTLVDGVALANTTSSGQDFTLDLQTHFQYFANNPSTNHGFTLKMNDESWSHPTLSLSRMMFYSSDEGTPSRRPKLTLSYYVNGGCKTYHPLQEKLSHNAYPSVSGKLYVKYRERYRQGILKFNIYDKSNAIVVDDGDLTIEKIYGMNWLEIDLSSEGLITDDHYILEVIDDKGNSKRLRFKYQ